MNSIVTDLIEFMFDYIWINSIAKILMQSKRNHSELTEIELNWFDYIYIWLVIAVLQFLIISS